MDVPGGPDMTAWDQARWNNMTETQTAWLLATTSTIALLVMLLFMCGPVLCKAFWSVLKVFWLRCLACCSRRPGCCNRKATKEEARPVPLGPDQHLGWTAPMMEKLESLYKYIGSLWSELKKGNEQSFKQMDDVLKNLADMMKTQHVTIQGVKQVLDGLAAPPKLEDIMKGVQQAIVGMPLPANLKTYLDKMQAGLTQEAKENHGHINEGVKNCCSLLRSAKQTREYIQQTIDGQVQTLDELNQKLDGHSHVLRKLENDMGHYNNEQEVILGTTGDRQDRWCDRFNLPNHYMGNQWHEEVAKSCESCLSREATDGLVRMVE
ncbi:unnamed protein product [Symbiodinium natans]|uniref:Uncharacterized protein n=1 Tax=Symbiodinium natans TaxID=878477 RepID=A0A812P250_9DINO|nr:unnamed protein product [Symbiodinium natans]